LSLTAAAFVMFFLAGCALALVRHPIYGLVTYVGEFYLHPASRWWGDGLPDLRWSLIAAGVTLIGVIAKKKSKRDIPLFSHTVMPGFVMFLVWIWIQSLWAMDFALHSEFAILMTKYAMLLLLIYRCVDSPSNLRIFLWAQVAGSFYLGWLVLSTYDGGRFEGFGAPGIDDANSGALQIVTGIFVLASLVLASGIPERIALVLAAPIIVNALVATISRSGFVTLAVGGALFQYFSPRRYRKQVIGFSALALVLFIGLTNPVYWTRIGSLTQAGEEVEGVDTGTDRLEIVAAQWRMFRDHPFGCGHRCTAILSPQYLDDRYLTTNREGQRGRSSHNTFMSILVEQGIPGIVLYTLFVGWVWRTLLRIRRDLKHRTDFLAAALPAVASVLMGIFIAELFVDDLKFEARVWFVGTLMALVNLGRVVDPRAVTDETRLARQSALVSTSQR
jgi:O-antigen ligase